MVDRNRLSLVGVSILIAMSFGIAQGYAEPSTISQCIGDVAPGKRYSEVNYNCDFAKANASNTDNAACGLTCAKRGDKCLTALELTLMVEVLAGTL
jgi:hypothetical protein